ncbi:MAG: hypothetical protein KAH97_02425 [Anaerolineales bacterium]|nr:hypothetical protein [Anaerolineales bacterium]
MAAQDKAIERVVSRLTALRTEFGPEERSILDQLIVGDTPEVVAHAADLGAAISARVIFDEAAVAYRAVES